MPFIGGSEAAFTDALQRVDSELGANTATCQQLRRAAKGPDPEKMAGTGTHEIQDQTMTIIDNNEGLRWFKGHLSNLFLRNQVSRQRTAAKFS
jgi:hypothetical protein